MTTTQINPSLKYSVVKGKDHYLILDKNENFVAKCYSSYDANLFCHAEELLNALLKLRKAFYVDGSSKALRAEFETTKLLIAKAKGES